ncbi:MAG: DinB family protein [Akkermansiaceae bacterium]
MQHLISANIRFLDQAERLLHQLGNSLYATPVESFYGSTVGQHLRHCLDHYHSFLRGREDARVDYDFRERSPDLEASVDEAVRVIDEVREQLQELVETEYPVGVLVKLDCGGEDEGFQPSTAGRELQFLLSHTVHHFAMIVGICKCLEVSLEEGFGVAPSTLRHHKEVSID